MMIVNVVCWQGGATTLDHDSDTDMIIDENQLSIGGLTEAEAAGIDNSTNQQGAKREPLQVRVLPFIFMKSQSFSDPLQWHWLCDLLVCGQHD